MFIVIICPCRLGIFRIAVGVTFGEWSRRFALTCWKFGRCKLIFFFIICCATKYEIYFNLFATCVIWKPGVKWHALYSTRTFFFDTSCVSVSFCIMLVWCIYAGLFSSMWWCGDSIFPLVISQCKLNKKEEAYKRDSQAVSLVLSELKELHDSSAYIRKKKQKETSF